MRTYRLNIIAEDLSDVQITDSPADWAGFSVIKARRGSAEPIFIPAGNESYIIEQFGPPRANNRDVQEIIDFNRDHPVFVSAPPGVEDPEGDERNRHGAVYVTKDGIYTGYTTETEADSTVKEREVFFDINQASPGGTDNNAALWSESNSNYPSKYVKFQTQTPSYAPPVFGRGDVIETDLSYEGDWVTVKAQVAENWDEKGDVSDEYPQDSDSDYTGSFEYLISELETEHGSYFDENPGRFRILRTWIDGTAGDFVGAMYAVPVDGGEEGEYEVYIRQYMSMHKDETANPDEDRPEGIYSSVDSKMDVQDSFFKSFNSSGSYERVVTRWYAIVEAVGMIYQNFPTSTNTYIRFNRPPRRSAEDNYLLLDVEDWPGRNISIASRDYEISFDENAEDGFGTSRYIKDTLNDRVVSAQVFGDEDDDPVKIEDIGPFKEDKIPADGLLFQLRGTRIVDKLDDISDVGDIADAMISGWDEAMASEYDGMAVFFAPRSYYTEGGDPLNGKLEDVRATHQFSRVVLPALGGVTDPEEIPEARSSYNDNHGLVYPINEIRTRDPRSGTAWWRFPVGSYSGMLVRIMRQKNGAWAPMFQNDSGNVGGQISASFEKIRIKTIPQELQREIDEEGFNTLMYDSDLGLVMVNQRTAQNPNTLNDASWLSHDMAFDLFKRAVQRNVMFPQLGKPIDAQYIGIRTRQLQNIAARFGNAFNDVRVEVDNLNTPETRAKRRFQMATSVQVTPFSEFVDFFFYNVAQTASVDDPFDD